MGNNKVNFSIEDFEKGLMLLGLITPKSIEEIHEKEELEARESIASKGKALTYFKRAVLAAEIVTKLKDERTFGRVKFQKIVYICEHVAELELINRYMKFAAGPFDSKFMHSINKEFKKQKWFDVVMVVNGDFKVPKYIPLANPDGYKSYYIRYFSEYDYQIQTVIELFRAKKTDDTELAATVLACVLELKDEGSNLKWDTLFERFYDWHDKKKRFVEERIVNSFDWLGQNGLLPEVTIS